MGAQVLINETWYYCILQETVCSPLSFRRLRLCQFPSERPDFGEHLLIDEACAHGTVPVQVVGLAAQVRHNATGVPPAAAPSGASHLVPPDGVTKGAIKQRCEKLALDKATEAGRQAKVAFDRLDHDGSGRLLD